MYLYYKIMIKHFKDFKEDNIKDKDGESEYAKRFKAERRMLNYLADELQSIKDYLNL